MISDSTTLDSTPPNVLEAPVQPHGPPAPARGSLRKRWARHAPFALVFALAIFLLTLNVGAPWRSSHEDNGITNESAAIDHIRFGLGFTKGQDFRDTSVDPPVLTAQGFAPTGVSVAQQFPYLLTGDAHPYFYGHHPPLLDLAIAGSLLTFGYHFWAVRLVPIVFTLLALLLFYRLMAVLFDGRIATFASALFITFPIAAYYGRDVAHEAPVLFCELGMALGYVLWRRSGRGGWLLAVAGCVALGVAFDWPMVYFAWILLALDVLVQRRVNWRVALATGGMATLTFALAVTQIAWAGGWSLATLQEGFLMRTASEAPLAWLKEVLRHNLLDFGLWTWLALPFALLVVWRRLQREGLRDGLSPLRALSRRLQREGLSLRAQMIALFALGGLAHILLFRDGAFVHDYWQFYLIPFYAAAFGWGGVALARWLAAHPLMARLRLTHASTEVREAATLFAFAGLALAMSAPLIAILYSVTTLY